MSQVTRIERNVGNCECECNVEVMSNRKHLIGRSFELSDFRTREVGGNCSEGAEVLEYTPASQEDLSDLLHIGVAEGFNRLDVVHATIRVEQDPADVEMYEDEDSEYMEDEYHYFNSSTIFLHFFRSRGFEEVTLYDDDRGRVVGFSKKLLKGFFTEAELINEKYKERA